MTAAGASTLAIADTLPGRTANAVSLRRRRLSIVDSPRWQEWQVQRAIAMRCAGRSIAAIAAKIGRSPRGVEKVLRRNNIPAPPRPLTIRRPAPRTPSDRRGPGRAWTTAEDVRLVKLRRQGFTLRQIADALGCKLRRVERRVRVIRALATPRHARAELQSFIRSHPDLTGKELARNWEQLTGQSIHRDTISASRIAMGQSARIASRRAAARLGWPGRPLSDAVVLDTIYSHGPQTVAQIRDAVAGIIADVGRPLQRLVRDGLVLRLPGDSRGPGSGRGGRWVVFALPLHAVRSPA
jgi:hypothetical protein